MVNHKAGTGCAIELPCIDTPERAVCYAVYSIASHKFVGGRVVYAERVKLSAGHRVVGRAVYALPPGRHARKNNTWRPGTPHAKRWGAAVVRLAGDCRLVPVEYVSIAVHPGASRDIWTRWHHFSRAVAPLVEFRGHACYKLHRIMGMRFSERATQELLDWIRAHRRLAVGPPDLIAGAAPER
jgi:hypothetical protein